MIIVVFLVLDGTIFGPELRSGQFSITFWICIANALVVQRLTSNFKIAFLVQIRSEALLRNNDHKKDSPLRSQLFYHQFFQSFCSIIT